MNHLRPGNEGRCASKAPKSGGRRKSGRPLAQFYIRFQKIEREQDAAPVVFLYGDCPGLPRSNTVRAGGAGSRTGSSRTPLLRHSCEANFIGSSTMPVRTPRIRNVSEVRASKKPLSLHMSSRTAWTQTGRVRLVWDRWCCVFIAAAQRLLATVVIGGLRTSTVLTLVVLATVYRS